MGARVETLELVRHLLTDSRLGDEHLMLPPREVPLHLRRPDPTGGGLIPLPPTPGAVLGLEDSLPTRISYRQYGSQPVSLAALTACLAAAAEGDRQLWWDEQAAGVDLNLWVLATRISNLLPGLYRYLPPEHGLTPITVPLTQPQVEEMMLQVEFSRAPAVMCVTGNLAAALARHGSHGYRHLLVRAGSAAHHGYLGALGQGLCGCLFAGLLLGPLRRWTHIDGYREAPLFALSFGHFPHTAAGQTSPTDPALGGESRAGS